MVRSALTRDVGLMKPQNKPATKSADEDVAEADLQSAGVGLIPEKIHEDDLVKTKGSQQETQGQGTEVPPVEPPGETAGVISGNSV